MKLKDNKTLKRTTANIFYPLLSLGIMLAVWAIASRVKGNENLLPMPSQTIAELFGLMGGVGFWLSVGTTLGGVLESFAIAFVSALACALIAGVFSPLHKVLSPIVTVLRAAPTLAVILLAMVWIDYEQVAILIGFLIAFPLLYQVIYTSVTGVDKELVEMTDLYKVGTADKIRYLYIPEIMPPVFDITASTLSLTVKVVTAAEIMCRVRDSIGLEMQIATQAGEMSHLIAWTLVAILLSFTLELAVKGLKKLWGTVICRI